MKRIIAIILVVVLILGLLGTVGFFLFKPKELLGSASVYNTVTLQIEDNLFYDVRVPVEAKLESTDGATIYSYDLLTVGVQDTEPSSFCKVKVGDRWVFGASKDGWLKATQLGFEEEQAYEGSYDIEETEWEDTVPEVVMELDEALLEDLKKGAAYTFGGKEFITSQIAYGTFDVAKNRALLKMSSLYKQPILYGMQTENCLWVTTNLYTVGVVPINFNTCLVVSAYGDLGSQYAAALVREAMK